MFTGIITDVARVESFERKGTVHQLLLKANKNTDDVEIGASIACNGVCLTVIEKREYLLKFELSPETINLTNYRSLKEGELVNVERSLKVGDELGGHYVSGHIDGVTEVLEVVRNDKNWVVKLSIPKELSKYIAKKGSVAINGVSLTVNEVGKDSLTVNIIPHSLEKTNLIEIDTGKLLNLEVDIFARYIERINNS